MTAERILVAQIGAAHGIRGEVRLWTFTADPMAVKTYGRLDSEDGRSFVVESVRQGKGFLVARLRGIADRNAAETLTNIKLYVPRERLPAPEDEETFYHADLIGLAAVAADGTELGTVAAVHDFGAGDLIEVRPTSGGASVMLPFTKAVVPVVDVKAGRLVVAPPDGMFGPPSSQDDGTSARG